MCRDDSSRRVCSARCPEPAEDRLERGDEGLHVGDDLAAEHLVHRRGHQVEPDAHQPQRSPGRRQQQPEEAAVEQRAQVLGRVEEVQRRPGRRGVHDDQVPATLARAAGRSFSMAMYSCVPEKEDDSAS